MAATTKSGRARPIAVGDRFGSLVVVADLGRRGGYSKIEVRCDCGVVKPMQRCNLRVAKSCGCLRGRHHHARRKEVSPEYSTWRSLRARCERPTNAFFPRYGGRGIRVCERWQQFDNFIADMGPKPSPRHSIDRIDLNGHYEPGNCRWATIDEQARNTSRTRMLEFRGERMCIVDWAKRTGISHGAIYGRIRAGWSVEMALTTPSSHRNTWLNRTPGEAPRHG